MPFNMNFSKESLSGKPPAPEGWYRLQFTGFKPVASKNKDSVNLQPQFQIVQNTEHEGGKVWSNMNTNAPFVIQDFVHACGLEMEQEPDGSAKIPGVFKGVDENPDDPTKWEYFGPLMNKIFEAELFISEYNGRKSNKIKQYRCIVPNCKERHSTNLNG